MKPKTARDLLIAGARIRNKKQYYPDPASYYYSDGTHLLWPEIEFEDIKPLEYYASFCNRLENEFDIDWTNNTLSDIEDFINEP